MSSEGNGCQNEQQDEDFFFYVRVYLAIFEEVKNWESKYLDESIVISVWWMRALCLGVYV